ncbi:hypothetical protein F5X96DRAFT_640617 [Biscogniauxia mediterranea]|nr:hypothetical protein F5X96DRAFT_640617 [Biscogniauxia mediterranea]
MAFMRTYQLACLLSSIWNMGARNAIQDRKEYRSLFEKPAVFEKYLMTSSIRFPPFFYFFQEERKKEGKREREKDDVLLAGRGKPRAP